MGMRLVKIQVGLREAEAEIATEVNEVSLEVVGERLDEVVYEADALQHKVGGVTGATVKNELKMWWMKVTSKMMIEYQVIMDHWDTVVTFRVDRFEWIPEGRVMENWIMQFLRPLNQEQPVVDSKITILLLKRLKIHPN